MSQTKSSAEAASQFPDAHVVQRDDGKWSIGWRDDAPGPFESRKFALIIAGHEEVLLASS